MLQRMIPLMAQKTQLEKQLDHVRPIHPELTEEEREQAARSAIDDAFVGGESKSDRPVQITEEDIRKQFPEQIDSTSWKAVLKALQNGSSKKEIVKDVLGCSQSGDSIGNAYFELLKRRFMDG